MFRTPRLKVVNFVLTYLPSLMVSILLELHEGTIREGNFSIIFGKEAKHLATYFNEKTCPHLFTNSPLSHILKSTQ